MTPTKIIPYFGYKNTNAAIEYLEKAFGFVKTGGYDDEEGNPMHAEMCFGNGVVMLGQSKDVNPGEQHGVYFVVEDVDKIYKQAIAAGAKSVLSPENTEWGARRARVKDLEGYEWSFGTYEPEIK